MPAPPKSDDQVPCNTIRLSEAFENYYRTTSPDRAAIEAELIAATEERETHIRSKAAGSNAALQTAIKRWNEAYDAREKSLAAADKMFRDALATDGPRACIRDPATGDILELNYRDWNRKQSFSGTPGFEDDFVDPDDPSTQPGPSAIRDGKMQPVFFDLEKYHRWLMAQSRQLGGAAGQKLREDEKHKRTKSDAVGKAVAALYPDYPRVPIADMTQTRNDKIIKWVAANKDGLEVSDSLIKGWFRAHEGLEA